MPVDSLRGSHKLWVGLSGRSLVFHKLSVFVGVFLWHQDADAYGFLPLIIGSNNLFLKPRSLGQRSFFVLGQNDD